MDHVPRGLKCNAMRAQPFEQVWPNDGEYEQDDQAAGAAHGHHLERTELVGQSANRKGSNNEGEERPAHPDDKPSEASPRYTRVALSGAQLVQVKRTETRRAGLSAMRPIRHFAP